MRIVIDIPEEKYNEYKRIGDSRDTLFEAIRNGKSLPKGHGRLIDAEKLTHRIKYGDVDDVMNEDWDGLYNSVISYIENAETIIEADKGE